MKRICAWCRKPLGEHQPRPDGQTLITHGLCPDCAHHLLAETGVPLTEYLNGIDAPVMVVDGDLTVQTANHHACALLETDLAWIEGRKNGDVFECANARLPGGCGRTSHCMRCIIRRTVVDTYETGEGRTRVPARFNREGADRFERVELLISTEKVDHVVLLRIDSVNGLLLSQ